MHSIAPPWIWGVFLMFVMGMLALDVFACGGGKAQKMSVRQAASWSAGWLVLALLFALGLWQVLIPVAGTAVAYSTAMEFVAGYLIEKSLSIDNIFIFLLIFNHFSVPVKYQRRVLLYGVLGAIVMRFAMIIAGVWVVETFSWVLYVFGAFLVLTGLKMMRPQQQNPDLSANLVVRLAKRMLPFCDGFRAEKFSVIENGKRVYTSLLLVLILVEISDVVFALDSIPAIFAITTDPFIVFTSNIFAIMGLRALYFLLADMAERFHFLKYGLALVLIFVGAKMLVNDWWHVPTIASLLSIATIVAGSVLISLLVTKGTLPKKQPGAD